MTLVEKYLIVLKVEKILLYRRHISKIRKSRRKLSEHVFMRK